MGAPVEVRECAGCGCRAGFYEEEPAEQECRLCRKLGKASLRKVVRGRVSYAEFMEAREVSKR